MTILSILYYINQKLNNKLFHTISNTTKKNERREIKKTIEKGGPLISLKIKNKTHLL